MSKTAIDAARKAGGMIAERYPGDRTITVKGFHDLVIDVGMLIIIEAGGQCSTLEGKPYRVEMPGRLAPNSFIHDDLLTVLHGNDDQDPDIVDRVLK